MHRITLKTITLCLIFSLMSSVHQPTRTESYGMALGGTALASYFGYCVVKSALEIHKSDEQIITDFESMAKQKHPENFHTVLELIYGGRNPQEFAQFYRKCIIASVCLVNAPLTALGAYLLKRSLAPNA